MVAEWEEDEDDSSDSSSPAIDCPVLVTERLVLRPLHDDDIPELTELANNRKIADMLAHMPHPYSECEARTFIESSRHNMAGGVTYAVTLAECGAFIGSAALHKTVRGLELGYWIGEPYWDRGYATETAHALVDLAFRAGSSERLHAACRTDNTASRRVIHKCGFQYIGQDVMDSLAVGRVAVERYSLSRPIWAGLRSWGRM